MTKKPRILLIHGTHVISPGGTQTFSTHLERGFQRLGYNVEIARITKRTEKTKRPFVEGCTYRNMALGDIDAFDGLKVLTVGDTRKHRQHEPLSKDIPIVIHDRGHLKLLKAGRAGISVGRVMGAEACDGRWIPHPYEPLVKFKPKKWRDRVLNAICRTRIDRAKNIPTILEANRSLSPKKRCQFAGLENRFYLHHYKVREKYPEYDSQVKGIGYSKEFGGGALLSCRYKFDVDLSFFSEFDAGRTQYVLLEAANAGTVPIMLDKWLVAGEEISLKNSVGVENAEELVELLKEGISPVRAKRIIQANYDMLENHAPEKSAAKLVKILRKM